jgi:hypothetical protein
MTWHIVLCLPGPARRGEARQQPGAEGVHVPLWSEDVHRCACCWRMRSKGLGPRQVVHAACSAAAVTTLLV